MKSKFFLYKTAKMTKVISESPKIKVEEYVSIIKYHKSDKTLTVKGIDKLIYKYVPIYYFSDFCL